MALEMEPEQWLQRLISAHDNEKPELENLNAHYEGTQPLNYLHPELLAELDDRMQQVVLAWPELVIGSLDDRLDRTGFRIAGQAKRDAGLEEIWQYNDLDESASQGQIESLVMRRAFGIVGANDDPDSPPLVTIESPLEVHIELDPRTREGVAAVKRWCEKLHDREVEHATLYLPNRTAWYVKQDGKWVEDPDYEPDDHNLGKLPVVPIVPRPRLGNPLGRSELASILPLSNAANKIATDMMVSAEFHAMPRRWALGFGPEDFQDEHGNKVSTWKRIAGRIWASSKTRQEGAEVGQFPEADLKNFHSTLELLAQHIAAMGALPPHYAGLFTAANPASADGIRSAEARLVKRAERRQRAFGGSYERLMRIADRVRTGEWRDELRSLETLWRDAATPTVAQAADAAVKKFQAKIVPLRQTREDLGYNDEQIKLMEEEDAIAEEREARILLGEVKPAPSQDPDLDEDQESVA